MVKFDKNDKAIKGVVTGVTIAAAVAATVASAGAFAIAGAAVSAATAGVAVASTAVASTAAFAGGAFVSTAVGLATAIGGSLCNGEKGWHRVAPNESHTTPKGMTANLNHRCYLQKIKVTLNAKTNKVHHRVLCCA